MKYTYTFGYGPKQILLHENRSTTLIAYRNNQPIKLESIRLGEEEVYKLVKETL
jgi:hypothetical protein